MHILIIPVLIGLFAAVQIKSKHVCCPTVAIPLIKSYSITNGEFVAKVTREYDHEGRLKQYLQRNYEYFNEGRLKETPIISPEPVMYEYYKDSILIQHGNRWSKMELNEKSPTSKLIRPNDFSKERTLTVHQTNTFDREGFIIKKVIFDDFISYSYSSTHYYEYRDGNLVKETITYHNVAFRR